MAINFTYNGKPYNSLDSAIEDLVADSIRESTLNTIKPFRSEITRHGGTVNVKINGDRLTVDCTNLPDDLIDRIQKAITG
jgi:hypothetical protein